MSDSDIQPIPAEEPQTPTPAPEPSPSEQPSVFETKPAEPAPAPVESPPTLETSASVEPPPASVTDNQQPTPNQISRGSIGTGQATDNKIPTAQPPQQSEPAQPSPSQIFSLKNLGGQDSRSFLLRAREKIQFRKKAKLEKIMALAAKKQSITNDDVEKLLRVSDATATRYLAELVRQERLERSGATKGIRFEPR